MNTIEVSKSNLRDVAPAPLPVVMIAPSRGWVSLNLRELWEYRELLYFFVWRDLKVRYKQTVLGAAWAVLQPLAAMIVFSVFFGKLAKVPSDGVPYPLFAYCALLPWQVFANSLTEAGNSLVNQNALLKKVYFPRFILPLTPIAAGAVDFAIGFLLLIALMFWYGVMPGISVVLVPLLLLFTMMVAVSVSLWVS